MTTNTSFFRQFVVWFVVMIRLVNGSRYQILTKVYFAIDAPCPELLNCLASRTKTKCSQEPKCTCIDQYIGHMIRRLSKRIVKQCAAAFRRDTPTHVCRYSITLSCNAEACVLLAAKCDQWSYIECQLSYLTNHFFYFSSNVTCSILYLSFKIEIACFHSVYKDPSFT